MLQRLREHPAALPIFNEVREVLGTALDDLDSGIALQRTRNIQLALFVAGVASLRILQQTALEEHPGAEPLRVDCVAGLSIGAFSAAVACGAFSLGDLLPVVALRGQAMHQAFPTGYGMLAVTGPGTAPLLRWVSSEPSLAGQAYLGSINSPVQVVFSGQLDALHRIAARVDRLGLARARLLDVPTPSHSPLLVNVSSELQKVLATIAAHPPSCAYLSNTTTRLTRDPEAIRHDLAANVCHPIRWQDAMELLLESGVTCCIESPPGDVLTRLGYENDPDGRARWIAIEERGFSYAARQLASL